MTSKQFFAELDTRIAKYDLLCHPFYEAWSAGELTREDLREYALDYYEQVHAFPSYLAAFALRLNEGELRRAVLANMRDEQGGENAGGDSGTAHSDLWLDFAQGMGAVRSGFADARAGRLGPRRALTPAPGDSSRASPPPPTPS